MVVSNHMKKVLLVVPIIVAGALIISTIPQNNQEVNKVETMTTKEPVKSPAIEEPEVIPEPTTAPVQEPKVIQKTDKQQNNVEEPVANTNPYPAGSHLHSAYERRVQSGKSVGAWGSSWASAARSSGVRVDNVPEVNSTCEMMGMLYTVDSVQDSQIKLSNHNSTIVLEKDRYSSCRFIH